MEVDVESDLTFSGRFFSKVPLLEIIQIISWNSSKFLLNLLKEFFPPLP